jgi:large subunit ribosomal protein L30
LGLATSIDKLAAEVILMSAKAENKLLAVVRIRGRVGVRRTISETLTRMNLKFVNNVTILYGNKSNMGMIKTVTVFVTYGEIEPAMLEILLKEREMPIKKEELQDVMTGKKSLRSITKKKLIRMHPPKHGYEGIKIGYSKGGALGYRGADINALIKRMI